MQVTNLLKEASLKKVSFIAYLGQYKYLEYTELAKEVALYFNLSYYDLDSYDSNLFPQALLNFDVIQRNAALPLYVEDQKLVIATYDPSILDLNEIHYLTDISATIVIVAMDKLLRIIDLLFSKQIASNSVAHLNLEKNQHDFNFKPKLDCDLLEDPTNLAPIVTLLNHILLDAINRQASDIHFEPYKDHFRIRFRTDGILQEISRQPLKIASYLILRLKVMAELDISERRLPQDGRFKMNLSKHRAIDLRLSTCPTLLGEKAVLRILDYSHELLAITDLGMSQEHLQFFKSTLKRTKGMILVTGPTGCGKTTTLYTALNQLNSPEVNILSIEDPVEILLEGINQVQINLKATLTFPKILRAFLRQDPDIIMIGEMRDFETADIAFKAAETGHLVLSTLHTNNAAETLLRLVNMGIAPFNVASCIQLIIAQRLVRKLCPHCKQLQQITPSLLLRKGFKESELNELNLFGPQGCSLCHRGYKGRTGIYEMLAISQAMATLITNDISAHKIHQQAQCENMITLRESALQKVRLGVTSIEEIDRIITD